jgi:hypothetical protein
MDRISNMNAHFGPAAANAKKDTLSVHDNRTGKLLILSN